MGNHCANSGVMQGGDTLYIDGDESEVGASEAIFTNLERAALPVVAVELLDGIASIIRRFEGNNKSD